MANKSPAPVASEHMANSPPQTSLREVDGIFFTRENLDHAVVALAAAGISYKSVTAVLERQSDGGSRVAVTDLPHAGFTQADKRQVRTLATSISGAVGALAALGITIASGGAAAAAVAAAVVVGGSAASGAHILKTLKGFSGDVPEEDIILSVRVNNLGEEKRVLEIFQQHGAEQIWPQNRTN